jgi:hypothetical protein
MNNYELKQSTLDKIEIENLKERIAKLEKIINDLNSEINYNKVIKFTPITRVEVINHAKNDKPIGRLLTLYKELDDFKSVELSFQDGGKTLKIFLG